VTTTRKYEKRLRAENAEQTRRRILDAVASRLRDAPTQPVSLDDVAQLARVARSTIYTVFGSRAGLFDAFVDDLWARTGLPSLTEAVANPDARQHLRAGITAASAMYAADRDIYRVLYSMAQLDPNSVGGAVAKMEQERSGGMAHVVNRLAEDGALRTGISRKRATDVLWMICSFDAFDQLYTNRDLSLDESVEVLISLAESALCSPRPAAA
jgi:AcrR family transcriptional regulator